MLQELVRPFNGLQEYKLVENERALVHFSKHEDAKVALAGNKTYLCISSIPFRAEQVHDRQEWCRIEGLILS